MGGAPFAQSDIVCNFVVDAGQKTRVVVENSAFKKNRKKDRRERKEI
jgi:hypothetical protein